MRTPDQKLNLIANPIHQVVALECYEFDTKKYVCTFNSIKEAQKFLFRGKRIIETTRHLKKRKSPYFSCKLNKKVFFKIKQHEQSI